MEETVGAETVDAWVSLEALVGPFVKQEMDAI